MSTLAMLSESSATWRRLGAPTSKRWSSIRFSRLHTSAWASSAPDQKFGAPGGALPSPEPTETCRESVNQPRRRPATQPVKRVEQSRNDEPRPPLGLVPHVVVLVLAAVAPARGQVRRRRRQLLQAQRDPAPCGVDPDHLDLQRLADLEHVLGPLDVVPRQLRDVQQALDPDHDLQEGAVLLGLRDLPFDDRPDRHRLHKLLPRVLLQLT